MEMTNLAICPSKRLPSRQLQFTYSLRTVQFTLYIFQRPCLLIFKNRAQITPLILLILWFLAKL
jgi:hypothetical protein